MTAEIVDLGKYREEKNRYRNRTPCATPEAGTVLGKVASPEEPVRARLNELRGKDGGEKV